MQPLPRRPVLHLAHLASTGPTPNAILAADGEAQRRSRWNAGCRARYWGGRSRAIPVGRARALRGRGLTMKHHLPTAVRRPGATTSCRAPEQHFAHAVFAASRTWFARLANRDINSTSASASPIARVSRRRKLRTPAEHAARRWPGPRWQSTHALECTGLRATACRILGRPSQRTRAKPPRTPLADGPGGELILHTHSLRAGAGFWRARHTAALSRVPEVHRRPCLFLALQRA